MWDKLQLSLFPLSINWKCKTPVVLISLALFHIIFFLVAILLNYEALYFSPLCLWPHALVFEFSQFVYLSWNNVGAIQKGGVGALELVAMDMKARL